MAIFDWHPHKSDTNAHAMYAEAWLIASGHSYFKVFTDLHSMVELDMTGHGQNGPDMTMCTMIM